MPLVVSEFLKFIFPLMVIRLCTLFLPQDPSHFWLDQGEGELNSITGSHSLSLQNMTWEKFFSLPQLNSLYSDQNQWPVLWEALKNTLALTIPSLCLALFFSSVLGWWVFQRRPIAQKIIPILKITQSLPSFVVALSLFGLILPLRFLPIPYETLLYPLFALTLLLFSQWGILLIDFTSRPFQFALDQAIRARGVTPTLRYFKHQWVPAVLSLAVFFAGQIAALFNGSILIEIVFNWKGIGFLFFDRLQKGDLPFIEFILFYSVFVSLCLLTLGRWARRRATP